jgi:hypothetical protein
MYTLNGRAEAGQVLERVLEEELVLLGRWQEEGRKLSNVGHRRIGH